MGRERWEPDGRWRVPAAAAVPAPGAAGWRRGCRAPPAPAPPPAPRAAGTGATSRWGARGARAASGRLSRASSPTGPGWRPAGTGRQWGCPISEHGAGCGAAPPMGTHRHLEAHGAAHLALTLHGALPQHGAAKEEPRWHRHAMGTTWRESQQGLGRGPGPTPALWGQQGVPTRAHPVTESGSSMTTRARATTGASPGCSLMLGGQWGVKGGYGGGITPKSPPVMCPWPWLTWTAPAPPPGPWSAT